MGSPRPWQLRRRPWLFCCVSLALCGLLGKAQGFVAQALGPNPGFAKLGRREMALRISAESAEAAESGAAGVALAAPERSRSVQVWSVLGVATYLSYGIKKVVPIVHQGLASITTPWQWLMLVATSLAVSRIFFFRSASFFSPTPRLT